MSAPSGRAAIITAIYSLSSLTHSVSDLRNGGSVSGTVLPTGDYRNLTFWADEQWLWIKDEFDAPAAQFFVRRGSDADKLMANGGRHDRYQIDLVVREIHAGHAWIEIASVERTEQQTPEGTILHAIRALDMVKREGWALAISELDRALRPNLPGHVRRELETIKGDCEAAKKR